MNNERVNAAIEKLVALLESPEAPDMIARSIIHPMANHEIPSAKWSASNVLIMLMNGTEDARGYQQWQAVGRQVNKGSKAFHILAPTIKKVKEEKDGTETEKEVVIGFHAVPVFRYEDTEGDALPDEAVYMPVTLPPLMDVAEKLGITVSWRPFEGKEYGYYRKDAAKIVLRSHDAEVFFHELAHAVHYEVCDVTTGSRERSRKEVVAEMSAAVIASIYGYQNEGTHIDYIKGWARAQKQDPGKFIIGLLSEVKAVVTKIFELASSTQVVA